MSKKFRNFETEQFEDENTFEPFRKKKVTNPTKKHNKTKRRKEIDIWE